MAQKDLCEKSLMAYNDVFADIVNGLLFKGRKVIREDDLVDIDSESRFKDGQRIHEQRRDVVKLWRNGKIKICIFGLENQTKVDLDMPLRIIGYDGVNYRSQLEESGRYPVVTLVLYFGIQRWKSRNLLSRLEIPCELRDYVNDYKINVFEIAWLEPKQLELFTSDFRIVADFFVQKRLNKKYIPSKDTIRHVDEILGAMAVLTGDRGYEMMQRKFEREESQGGTSMCEVLKEWHDNGYNEGIDFGRTQGIELGRTQGIELGTRRGIELGTKQGISIGKIETAKGLIKMGILSMEQIAEVTKLSMDELEKLSEMEQ